MEMKTTRWRISVAEVDICAECLPGKDKLLADALSRIRAAEQPRDGLVVSAVTCRATKSNKGTNMLDRPRSGMADRKIVHLKLQMHGN